MERRTVFGVPFVTRARPRARPAGRANSTPAPHIPPSSNNCGAGGDSGSGVRPRGGREAKHLNFCIVRRGARARPLNDYLVRRAGLKPAFPWLPIGGVIICKVLQYGLLYSFGGHIGVIVWVYPVRQCMTVRAQGYHPLSVFHILFNTWLYLTATLCVSI